MGMVKFEFEVPDFIPFKIVIEEEEFEEWKEYTICIYSEDALLADDFEEIVKRMEKHGYELYSLFAAEDGLELKFVKGEGHD